MSLRARSGFTLTEVVIVAAILSIITAIALVTLRPADRIASSRNARRMTEAQSIAKAAQTHLAKGGSVIGYVDGQPWDGSLGMIGKPNCDRRCKPSHAVRFTSHNDVLPAFAVQDPDNRLDFSPHDHSFTITGWVKPDTVNEPQFLFSNIEACGGFVECGLLQGALHTLFQALETECQDSATPQNPCTHDYSVIQGYLFGFINSNTIWFTMGTFAYKNTDTTFDYFPTDMHLIYQATVPLTTDYQHFSVTYDHDALMAGNYGGFVKIYLNGTDLGATPLILPSDVNQLSIDWGALGDASTGIGIAADIGELDGVIGNVDDFRVYDRVLSSPEIALLGGDSDPFNDPENGLLSRWSMEWFSNINGQDVIEDPIGGLHGVLAPGGTPENPAFPVIVMGERDVAPPFVLGRVLPQCVDIQPLLDAGRLPKLPIDPSIQNPDGLTSYYSIEKKGAFITVRSCNVEDDGTTEEIEISL